MVYLMLVCATGAVIVLTISLAMIATKLHERSRPFLSQYFRHGSGMSVKGTAFELPHESSRLLWRMTAWLGYPLMPFVTWGQRRRLTLLLSRAGLATWEYVQIYSLQCVSAFLTLTICVYWLSQSLLGLQFTAYLSVCACVVVGWWCPIVWLKHVHRNRLHRI